MKRGGEGGTIAEPVRRRQTSSSPTFSPSFSNKEA
ncbi:hypothetical protein A2U01_0090913, partial [Trifolium medium]|nr:hypothetical protein [Trifolium medium]